jgi:hypothetical protein
VSWIHENYDKAKFSGVELASVTRVSPQLEIKIDGMDQVLDASFLVIPKRFIEDELDMSGTWTISANTQSGQTDTSASHLHQIGPLPINEMSFSGMRALFKYKLDVGERIAVVPALGGKRYMILDKVVVQ